MALTKAEEEGKLARRDAKLPLTSSDAQRAQAHVKSASEADIDLLLAEGKAAAASLHGSPQKSGDINHKSPHGPLGTNPTITPDISSKKPNTKDSGGSIGSLVDREAIKHNISNEKLAQVAQKSPGHGGSIVKLKLSPVSLKQVKDSHSTKLVQKQEIIGNDGVKSTSPFLATTPQGQYNADNEFQYLNHQELQDLRDWLLITGFNNVDHRNNRLHRCRRLAALDAERAELIREEQSERSAISGSNDVLLAQPLFAQTVVMNASPSLRNGAQSVRDTTCSSPPLLSLSESQISANTDIYPAPTTERCSTADENIDCKPSIEDPLQPTQTTLKRERPASPECKEIRRKVPRGDLFENGDGAQVYENQDQTGRHDLCSDKRSSYGTPPRGNEGQIRKVSASIRSEEDRIRRNNSHERFPRPSSPPEHANRRYIESNDDQRERRPEIDRPLVLRGIKRLGLNLSNTSFFLIKSFDYVSVEASQDEGIWVLQEKNQVNIANAFRRHDHVIFVFSVNGSSSFQGYAKLITNPEKKKIPVPEWALGTRFRRHGNPAVKVEWINTSTTPFRCVGKLINSYNDDPVSKSIFRGRDGQEIEPGCGLKLCKTIDDVAAGYR
ncbi:hypothetical protein FQN49_000167 [Arthroderma sp. PD_2]|nr:hypothetical protein FQN49_000167 [Arthroderma sp. PD_2]